MRRRVQQAKIALAAPGAERGQTLVILTFGFVALLALVGTVADGATVYVQYDHLRRSLDAAAVSAVNQYREGRSAAQVYDAAVQALQLQLPGVQNVRFYWCNASDSSVVAHSGETYESHDAGLCSVAPDPPRKRVRVEAELPVDLIFMSLVWGDQVTLRAKTEAEAAVLNMVLLIDTSESMAYDTCPGSLPEPDFFACLETCVAAGNCQPFEDVRTAAHGFVQALMRDEVDQVSIYHFDKAPVISPTVEMFTCGIPNTLTFPVTQTNISGMIVPLTTTKSIVLDAIDLGRGNPSDYLNAYIRPPARDADTGESCIQPTHVGGWYGQEGMGYGYRWASTNIGGGVYESIAELVRNGSADAAIWVIVLLSDGAANATDQAASGAPGFDNGYWTCPAPAGLGPNERDRALGPFCRDPECDVGCDVTRHCPSQSVCDRGDPWYTNPGHVYDEWEYDADDYARDIADLASSQEIAVYTIGFGPNVNQGPPSHGRRDAGERLLRYIADVGDDGDLETAPCGSDDYWDASPVVVPVGDDCGNYYFAPDAAGLVDVFEDIVSRIFSRITE